MTTQELIDQLKELPPNTQVYLWLDGERRELAGTDDAFVGEYQFVELNAGEQA